ncbi:MAG: hypothetical protein QOI06_1681 [Nocardioidaceae bacterium]|nr:hypothetical protein [Nocardioidaceae bacterium]
MAFRRSCAACCWPLRKTFANLWSKAARLTNPASVEPNRAAHVRDNDVWYVGSAGLAQRRPGLGAFGNMTKTPGEMYVRWPAGGPPPAAGQVAAASLRGTTPDRPCWSGSRMLTAHIPGAAVVALFGWVVPLLGHPGAELQKVLDTIERAEIHVAAHPLREIRTHLLEHVEVGLSSPPLRMLRLRLRHRGLVGLPHAAHSSSMTNVASRPLPLSVTRLLCRDRCWRPPGATQHTLPPGCGDRLDAPYLTDVAAHAEQGIFPSSDPHTQAAVRGSGDGGNVAPPCEDENW